jgi:Predicted transcriptional regulators
MEVYFKIGEIAEFFDISVRALHLYDKIGLLKPEHIDEETGYRYYAPDQINRLQTILSLKKIGFSLNEINILYSNGFKEKELLDMLIKKEEYFQQQIEIANFNIDNIRRMKKEIENSSENMKTRELSEEEKAVKMSRIVCLENIKLENIFSEILWL